MCARGGVACEGSRSDREAYKQKKISVAARRNKKPIFVKVGDHYSDFRLLGSRRPSLLTITRDSPQKLYLQGFFLSELCATEIQTQINRAVKSASIRASANFSRRDEEP